jgi:hypothetical protein
MKDVSTQEYEKLINSKSEYAKEIFERIANENFTFFPISEKCFEEKIEPYDPDNVIKALLMFEDGDRIDIDLNDGFSFAYSYLEHRVLSAIYEDYEDFLKIMKELTIGNIHYLIESYRDTVTRDASELIGYWSSKIKGIKSSRKRIRSGKDALKKKKADRMQPVIEAYFRIDKEGMKPHRIATTIKEYLESIHKTTPSIDTIKRYLKEENLI